MIESSPRWKFTARYTLTQSYGHVQLLPEHVLGQWFCLARGSGAPLWERTFDCADTVCGLADGVVVASETVSRGPGTWSEGCYGISLATGELLWTSHGEDGKDSPAAIQGNEVVCRSGSVVSISNGHLLRRISCDERRAIEEEYIFGDPSDAMILYSRGRYPNARRRRVWLDGVGWLTLARKPRQWNTSFLLSATDSAGAVIWAFDLATTGYVMNHFNYFASRLVGRHVYVIASEGPNSRRLPAPRYVQPIPTRFHLLTVELERGTIVQDVYLSDQPVTECRIEDADDRAVLVSTGGREIAHYRRMASV
jgi:hypothetical protein